MFAEFYASSWQHPILLLLLPGLFVLKYGRELVRSALRHSTGHSDGVRTRFLAAYLLWVLLNTALDASLTSDSVVRHLPWLAPSAKVLAIAFVILGDLRVFWLVFRLFAGASSWLVWLLAIGASFVGPLAQAALVSLFPDRFGEVRLTFLSYEAVLLLLIGAVRWRLSLRFGAGSSPRELGREVLTYAMGYYALWILSDVLILAGFDLGYLLRVVPNVLYYGAFVPFVYSRARYHALLPSS